MSSKAEVVVVPNTELERVVAKPIEVNRKDEKFAKFLPLGFFGGLSALVLGSGFAFGVSPAEILNVAPVILGIMGLGGTFTTKISLIDVKETAIRQSTSLTRAEMHSLKFRRNEAGNKSAFVGSFHVKEKGELDIDSWVDPKNQVGPGEATHTIHQSLIKTKKGYFIEQKIVPNAESIWDLSADALVEVYRVQENTASMKEVTT